MARIVWDAPVDYDAESVQLRIGHWSSVLMGVRDAYTLEKFISGDIVYQCQGCKAAYSINTYLSLIRVREICNVCRGNSFIAVVVPHEIPSPSVVLDQSGNGDFRTLEEAIRRCPVGHTIAIRPGRYQGGMTFERSLALYGDGPREDILIVADEGIRITSGQVHLVGLTITACVTSRRNAGVTVTSTEESVIRNCEIHHNNGVGILVIDRGRGEIVDCQIHSNALSGVEIQTHGDPVIRNCEVRDNKAAGILVIDRGRGEILDCQIHSNALSGVEIRTHGNPLIRNCEVRDNKGAGMFFMDQGRGNIANCLIYMNRRDGIYIDTLGNPSIAESKIYQNTITGICFVDDGRGSVQKCQIYQNTCAGVEIGSRARPDIRDCVIWGGSKPSLWITAQGAGKVESCNFDTQPHRDADGMTEVLHAITSPQCTAGRQAAALGHPQRFEIFGSKGAEDGKYMWPRGIAVDRQGNVYVMDRGNNRVQKLTSDGLHEWTLPRTTGPLPIGSRLASGRSRGQFNDPWAVTIDPVGNIWVVEKRNHRVQKLSPTGEWLGFHLRTAESPGGADRGTLHHPWGIAISGQTKVLVADAVKLRIQELTLRGDVTREFSIKKLDEMTDESLGLDIKDPGGIAIDHGGNIWFANRIANCIQKFSAEGVLLGEWGREGTGLGEFGGPRGIAVAPDGSIWVAEWHNKRIQKLSPEGEPMEIWGGQTNLGNGASLSFSSPAGIAVDLVGNVWITDNSNHNITKLITSPF